MEENYFWIVGVARSCCHLCPSRERNYLTTTSSSTRVAATSVSHVKVHLRKPLGLSSALRKVKLRPH